MWCDTALLPTSKLSTWLHLHKNTTTPNQQQSTQRKGTKSTSISAANTTQSTSKPTRKPKLQHFCCFHNKHGVCKEGRNKKKLEQAPEDLPAREYINATPAAEPSTRGLIRWLVPLVSSDQVSPHVDVAGEWSSGVMRRNWTELADRQTDR